MGVLEMVGRVIDPMAEMMRPPPGMEFDFSQPRGEPALVGPDSISWRIFKNPVTQLGIFTVTSWAAIFVARPGWPALWRVLLVYGFLARIPVLVVMFLAIFGGWDSHYAKPRPDFPAMGPWGLFFWTALLPQFSVWIYLTVVGGLLFGALAMGIHRLMSRTATSPASA